MTSSAKLKTQSEMSKVELAPRKMKILAAVIETFSVTGEPVGSKALLEKLDFSVSSATIRNEMADLAEKGLLIQPHTSAGRIPSKQGYRLYLNSIVSLPKLSQRDKSIIDEVLFECADEPEHILTGASDVLAQITGLTCAATTPPGNKALIQRIRFVQTGRQTAMLVLITNTGMVKTQLFRVDYSLTHKILEVFELALNERLVKTPLIAITPAFIQSMCASLSDLSMLLPSILLALMESAKEASGTNVTLAGQANLLFCHDFDITTVRKVSSFLNNKERVTNLLLSSPEHTRVFLGEESECPELVSSGVILSKYVVENQQGAIALFGPIRMNYPRFISLISYTACKTEELINGLLEP